jgi:hypothetical protein
MVTLSDGGSVRWGGREGGDACCVRACPGEVSGIGEHDLGGRQRHLRPCKVSAREVLACS